MSYELGLFGAFEKSGLSTFFGVPDSTLKSFLALLQSKSTVYTNVHESISVAQAMGYQMATGSIPCVFIQNSGLGNIINPVTSLAHKRIYSIPLFFLIGWRGGPNVEGNDLHDEPQHTVMGKVTEPILETIGVDFDTLSGDLEADNKKITRLFKICSEQCTPVALIVPRGLLDENSHIQNTAIPNRPLTRYKALTYALSKLKTDDLIISTTGMTSRELCDLRQKAQQDMDDFLTVGGMGLASQIAAGLCLGLGGSKRVVVFDGDGAAQMHLGGMMELAFKKNLIHILINNGIHGSVGGQSIANPNLDYQAISKTFGYDYSYKISSPDDFDKLDLSNHNRNENIFVEIMVGPGNLKNIGRPTQTPYQTKMAFLRKMNHA